MNISRSLRRRQNYRDCAVEHLLIERNVYRRLRGTVEFCVKRTANLKLAETAAAHSRRSGHSHCVGSVSYTHLTLPTNREV